MANTTKGTTRHLSTMSLFPSDYIRDEAEMGDALRDLIRSASGWRMIFADEANDSGPEISDTKREIAAAAGSVFAAFLRTRTGGKTPSVALATDTRPTGPQIAAAIARALIAEGVELRYLGVSAAPEIMAHVRRRGLDGFVYVTASHNPIGHNGLKFGLSDGGVVGGADAQALIHSFDELIADSAACRTLVGKASSVAASRLSELDVRADAFKQEALADYRSFTLEVASMSTDSVAQHEAIEPIRTEAQRRKLGIVVDFNGSARAASIDRELFESLGVRFSAINDTPGEIVHTIVPEGEALEPCSAELESMFSRDHAYLLGYVPDNDGDRGNLVYVDPHTGRAQILQAQEVFALSCMAELAYLASSDRAQAVLAEQFVGIAFEA